MNRRITKLGVFLNIGLFVLMSFSVKSQVKEIGLMPPRMTIADFSDRRIGSISLMDFMMSWASDEKGIERFYDLYYPLLLENVEEAFKEKDIDLATLDVSKLDKDGRYKEKELYKIFSREYSYYLNSKVKPLFGTSGNAPKQTGDKTGPMCNYFADQLDRDYLLYISLDGHHVNSVFQKKGKKAEYANGNFDIIVCIVDGNSGLIVEDFSYTLNKNIQGEPTNSKIKEKDIERIAYKIAKKVAKKMNKLD